MKKEALIFNIGVGHIELIKLRKEICYAKKKADDRRRVDKRERAY